MSLKNFFNDLNLNGTDKKYLIALLCFSIALTFVLMTFHMGRGAFSSDVSVYLASALDLAGLNVNHISDPFWIQNSPTIMFLTSLFFRAGYVNAYAIIYVGAIFGIIGIFGMYVFLRKAFNPLLSITGAILYHSLSLTLFYYANGMLDVPAIAMLLWTLIFTFAAVDKNPKYYVLVGISFALAFFIRYTNTYIIAIIALYVLKNHDIINLIECLISDISEFKNRIIGFFKSNEFKWIIISTAVFSCIFLFVIGILIFFYNTPISYLSAAQGSVSGYGEKSVATISDKWYFIKNFLNLLSCDAITFKKVFIERFNQPSVLSYLIMSILSIGIILKIINYVKNRNFFKNNYKPLKYRNKFSKIFLVVLMFCLIVIGRIGFKFNYLITLISFWIIFLILMSLIREYPIDRDKFSVSLAAFGLFLFYFIAVSFINLKCFRYLLPAFPGFVYLVIYSLDYICEFVRDGLDNEESLLKKFNKENIIPKSDFRKNISKAVPIIFIIVCLFFAFNFTNTVEVNENGNQIIELCDFIKEYDPDYQSKDIITLWDIRYFEWYLNKDIDKLDVDVDKLDPNKYEYVITFDKPYDSKDYKKVINIGYYYLNERVY